MIRFIKRATPSFIVLLIASAIYIWFWDMNRQSTIADELQEIEESFGPFDDVQLIDMDSGKRVRNQGELVNFLQQIGDVDIILTDEPRRDLVYEFVFRNDEDNITTLWTIYENGVYFISNTNYVATDADDNLIKQIENADFHWE
ncbi:hypothetical protein [Geomicrobium sp. JCM 19039]|uniref:hypothetical protein n=1 Tax=Geomicrobium sp. JCM 19039 TaxID=1460636 RepID=UPI00045F2E95|nr:hypothetical protein [Geomicrobium sp. JCM 19039]GAK13391.1 hypothetical protein JCM19039_3234 [Geomicrobium sp. JCM 19039]